MDSVNFYIFEFSSEFGLEIYPYDMDHMSGNSKSHTVESLVFEKWNFHDNSGIHDYFFIKIAQSL